MSNRRDILRILSLSGIASFIHVYPNNTSAQCVTTSDILGPFYLPNAPEVANLAPEGVPGTPIFITGTVYANDCESPLENAKVEVWHASDEGDYEDDNYRGVIYTNDSGQYAFQSILPGKYLNGAQFRPRHFHYIVSHSDEELTTQIYFEGDTSIPSDPWASLEAAEERIIPLTEDSGNLHGVADIFLNLSPPINSEYSINSPNNRSKIERIAPNPLSTEGVVSIYLARASVVDMIVFNLQGQQLSQWVTQKNFPPGKHELSIRNLSTHGLSIQPQVAILILVVNGITVDARRFLI
jgi:protocatechuate 3,4-dioxygenase beta subunit